MDQLMINLYMVFNWLFHFSCTASILVLIILLTKMLFKNNLGVRFHYAIWFILILKLIVPFTYESSSSLFNIIPITKQNTNTFLFTNDFYTKTIYSPIAKQNNQANVVSSSSEENVTFTENSNINVLSNIKSYVNKIPAYEWFLLVWIAGMLLLGIYTIVISIIFNYKVTHSKVITDKDILNILEQCKSKINLKKSIPIIELKEVCSPAISGFINPKILIPPNFLNTINLSDFHYVFLHELCHFKRKDIILNYFIRVLCILHWFNPLIWYAFYRMRQDRELCCDATALSYINPENTKEYGHTILNLISNLQVLPRVAGVSGMLENKSQIKKRIILIKSFKKDSYKLSVLSVIVLLLFACIMLPDAKAEQNIEISSKVLVSHDGATMRIDNVNYSFTDDPSVIGKWTSVGFVREIAYFNPDIKISQENLYLKNLNFKENGETDHSWESWTKGSVIHHGDKTASAYTLKEINGSIYMFLQWKSGDYVFRNMIPYYYVLKKTL